MIHRRALKSLIEVSLKGIKRETLPQVEGFLCSQGVFSGQTALSFKKRVFSITFYQSSLKKVLSIKSAMRQASVGSIRFFYKRLAPEDWLDKWKEDYHIMHVGKKIIVVPVWDAKRWKYDKRYPVFLNPQSAFGSGMHETTQQMIRMMEPLEGKFNTCLDLGTGTGILAVTARQLGASSVTGMDMDAASVQEAAENYRLNLAKGGNFFTSNLSSLKLRDRYDLVLANLNSKVLEKYQAKIRRSVTSGGYLLIAGILKRDERMFLKKFRPLGMNRFRVLRGRRWFSAAFRKK